MSRSALDRLRRRRGHSRLPASSKPDDEHKPFKAYEPCYGHVDVKYLPQMQDEDQRRYVFVAIERATRWCPSLPSNIRRLRLLDAFLAAVRKAAPFKTFTTFTGNGKEFTDKLFGSCQRWASMSFQLCLVLGMEHRLTKPKVP